MRMMLAGSVHRLFQVPSSKADLDVYKTINQSSKSKAVAVLNSIPSTWITFSHIDTSYRCNG